MRKQTYRERILELIDFERTRQIESDGDEVLSHQLWFHGFMQKVAEVAYIATNRTGPAIIHESLLQAAVLLVAWLECVERTGGNMPDESPKHPVISDRDAIFLSYLNGEVSEGFASKWLQMDRLTFREALSVWLKSLMDNKQVPVEGWRPTKE